MDFLLVDFLLVVNSNLGPISYRFQDLTTRTSEIAWATPWGQLHASAFSYLDTDSAEALNRWSELTVKSYLIASN